MRITAVNPALVALNLTHVPYFDYAPNVGYVGLRGKICY